MDAEARMFTGIISDIGRIEARQDGRFRIACHYPPEAIPLGASIACDGCCLTVTALIERPDGTCAFEVDASSETLDRTTLKDWAEGRKINLERALKMGDELGGHMVSGHVDGCASLLQRRPDGESVRLTFQAPEALARYIAQKGSVALNGVSLTVNEVTGSRFGVTVIPFTLSHTNLGELQAGDLLNLETDMLARYVERMLDAESAAAPAQAAPASATGE